VRAAIVAADDSASHQVGTVRFSTASASATLTISTGRAKIAIALPANERQPREHNGLATSSWTVKDRGPISSAPAELTFDQVVVLAGGHIPIGLNPRQHPGPFNATWTVDQSVNVWAADGVLLDAAGDNRVLVKLSGGGLQTPRTLSVQPSQEGPPARSWRVAKSYRDKAIAALTSVTHDRNSRFFWATQLPTALLIGAAFLTLFAGRALLQQRCTSDAARSL
jgi:high-affinity iron transporter